MLMLAQILIMFGRTSASKSRISEVLNTDTSLEYLINDLSVKAKPSLIVKDVSFKYPGTSDDNYALKNINFTLKAGETLGIIGQTGSGKSTLVHLLARLYDVTDGEIILDDHNVKDYSADNLLDAINIVFQNNMLFSGTIRDNLLWGNKDASDEEINRALEASLSDEIVNKLANGLNSEVGQAGSLLSGGQKQRIALARALLKRPKILVLDDSLSAIDTINEGKIRTKLRKLYPELTLIIVAQRVSAIKDADHILVLHEGEIHGAGTHNSLVENDEIYHDIYTTQLKGAKA
jgi:ATP-binding cassette subfamily B protein